VTVAEPKEKLSRREMLRRAACGAGIVGVVGATGALAAARSRRPETVWQIDPEKCIQCGNCATYCVLEPSAVKCVHAFVMCGYCELCFGYFQPGYDPPRSMEKAGGEAQLCPTAAITRRWIEGPLFEYTIDEELCIGCGKCVEGCTLHGNGSLFLQVRHDRCLNCNECAIAAACPSDAFVRVPADDPYILKGEGYEI
jgi:electron transport complex protein RnfB